MSFFAAELKIKFMLRALELAQIGARSVPPNPMVGAVLATPDGNILSESWHKKYKEHHAEYAALQHIEKVPASAILFVNLEPCAHHSNTPPCCDIIISKQVKHVVYGCLDPNPKVNGQGIQLLQKAGIKVELSKLQDMCLNFNRFFIHHTKEKSAYLGAKFGASLDGKIALQSGQSKWITNPKSRQKVQELRYLYQAVAIGKNTLTIDNPRLTLRDLSGADIDSSIAVIFSSDGNIEPDLNVLKNRRFDRKLLISGKDISIKNQQQLAKLNVEIIKTSTKTPHIKEALQKLYQVGIFSVLLEGGSQLLTSALKEGQINYLHIFKAPIIIGGDGIAAFGDLKLTDLANSPRFKLISTQNFASDIYSEYQTYY